MHAYARLSPTYVRAQIERLKVTHPEIWSDDEKLLEDSLEAETGLKELLDLIFKYQALAKADAEGTAHLINDLKGRQSRKERQAEALRDMALKLLLDANLTTIKLKGASLSVHPGQPKVQIIDESAIPPDLFRVKREPDKLAIKERLYAHENVPGAELSNAEPFLVVRIK